MLKLKAWKVVHAGENKFHVFFHYEFVLASFDFLSLCFLPMYFLGLLGGEALLYVFSVLFGGKTALILL